MVRKWRSGKGEVMEQKELTLKLIKMENGSTRLVVWEDNQVIEIFESDSRSVLNHMLNLSYIHGFTEEKFKVRK